MAEKRKNIDVFSLFTLEGESSTTSEDTNNDIPFKEDLVDSGENTEESEDVENKETINELEDDSEDSNDEDDNAQESDEDDLNSDDESKELDANDDDQESDEGGVYSSVANYLIEEGALTPLDNKEYDESDEGFAELITDTVEYKYNERVSSLESLKLTETANLKDLVNFIEAGGDPKEFLNNTIGSDIVDYRQVDVTTDEEDLELSINTQKAVIKDRLALDELTEEEIEETLEDFEKSNTLEKQAKIALKVLIKKQDDDYQNMLDSQEKARKDAIEYSKKQEQELITYIKSKEKIAGLDVDHDNFIKYLTVPVKKDASGRLLTKYDLDIMDQEKRLEAAYLQFKGGIKAVESKVEKKNTQKLKEVLSRFGQEDKNIKKSTETFDNDVNEEREKRSTKKVKLPWMM